LTVAVPARWLAVGLGVVAMAASACAPSATVEFQTVVPSDQSRATISAQPSGERKVDPSQRITVTATDGQLATVSVTGPKGPMSGQLSADGTTWTADKPNLAFGSTYTVAATAVDPRGVPTTQTDAFRTVEPKAFVAGSVQPGEGSTVGVGMPISVTFDQVVKNKEEIERALVVYTPTPIEGAWSWTGDTVARFRPKKYWPGDIDVTVALNLKGIKAAKGIFGEKNTMSTFHIGPSMVVKVDAQTHQAKVIQNGEKVRTIPVTTGKAGFETRSGNLIIISKEPTRIMDAATGGTDPTDPEYYRLEVQYAMRITYSGEFLHAAPWSVGSQGYANVSHGCIGMSTTNAQWLFENAMIGDPVEITGTSSPQNLGNGVTVWTTTWDEWLQDSATGAVTTSQGSPADTAPAGDAAPADGTEAPQTSPDGGTTTPDAPGTPGTASATPQPGTGAQQASYRR
jgi:lipoprotein-anchoring transpeptidase ErfK/SrfK